ncbi:MAG: hypothetical protein KF760_29805 [Candidatus Eremiobacteraeota bacterium]|nr:hypothetical protein [Candidatus Eremiobacteraeota bacterium]MCW5866922.1 hypothetical protein [Candidatus Eremiobacteraeota bacterium]
MAMIARLLLFLMLLGSSGCVRSAEVLAEEQRLEEANNRLEELKESIKDLPRLQAEVRELERQNQKLRSQLKTRHR